jgi:uracil-DNA glycosylase
MAALDLHKTLDVSWSSRLKGALTSSSFVELQEFLASQQRTGKQFFPPIDQVFAAFHACPFEDVKVVIVGQDPYHGPGQAHGLAFSVRPDLKKLPPSLVNIRKEVGIDPASIPHGSLVGWARQGVLLLNTVLTVEEKKANSHANRGWENFTDGVISALNAYHTNLVFILWGAPAKKKCLLVDRNKHHVLEAPHPSPLSANPRVLESGRKTAGFFGCDHFRKCNDYLREIGRTEIDWFDLPADVLV